MTTRPRQIHLGCFPIHLGGNSGAWMHPEIQPDGSSNLDWVINFAKIAERGKFDILFVADGMVVSDHPIPFEANHFEPITILSALAAVTKNIGLVATMSTSYSQPFTTARQMASLDVLSGGRAAWNVVTSSGSKVGTNFGKDVHYAHSERYKMAEEYIQVVQGLWDGWEDDAFPRDKASGVYADMSKMHRLNHEGEYFKVRGPLNIERSPQGQPVIFQAGASDTGRDFAAKLADAVFTNRENIDECRAYSADLGARANALGRPAPLVFPVVTPIIGGTEEEAKRKSRELNDLLDPWLAVSFLHRYFKTFDFSQCDLDAPFPDLSHLPDASQSSTRFLMNVARDEGLTLRQLAYRAAAPRPDFTGTPEQVADQMQRYFESHASDGFMIATDISPRGLEDVVDHVVPILQKRGLFRTEYEDTTLRGILDLDVPENRYTVEARQQMTG